MSQGSEPPTSSRSGTSARRPCSPPWSSATRDTSTSACAPDGSPDGPRGRSIGATCTTSTTAWTPDSSTSRPGADPFDAMGMKTCVRMLAKYVPKSTSFEAMARAIAVDEGVRLNYAASADAAEVTERVDTLDGEVIDEPSGGDGPPPVEEWPTVTPTAHA